MKNDLDNVARLAFDAVSRLGLDGAELHATRGRTEEFNIDAGKFSLLRTTFNSAFSIKVLAGKRKGAAVINSHDRDSVNKAIEQAAESARSSEPDDAEYIADYIGEHAFSLGAGECDLDGIYTRMDELLAGCRERFPLIDLSQIVSSYGATSALYANTNGTRVHTDSASYGHMCMFSAREGERVSSFNAYGFSADNIDTPFFQNNEVLRLLSETERQIVTSPVGGKFTGALVIAPDCLAELIFSIIGNCVRDMSLIAGSSPWLNKLGEAVADSGINVALDPLDPRVVCGARATADGHLTKRQEIIRDGVLTGWALSQYGARKTGLERSGNISGNLIVGTGDKTFDELVSGVEHGIFLNRFSGGTPSQNGDFTGVAKNSFLIKDGKIGDAISETMISGNLYDMIKNVAGIGSQAVCDGSSAVPYAAFNGVTVSG